MDKRRIDVIKQNEISQLYAFRLGSFEQKVLIEGRKADLPIVLSLHGGPGTPIPISVGCRGMFHEFTNKYIMVYWNQYGCGINNARIDNTVTIDMFVDMANDLVREIKQLYPNNKLYIFATSWGSILSAKLIEKPDSLVDGVVVWGQIIKTIFYNKEEIGRAHV